tara:strand:+ start:42 stop:890 length:849 start_codon:yes stop_codon:yes gene_type:complete
MEIQKTENEIVEDFDDFVADLQKPQKAENVENVENVEIVEEKLHKNFDIDNIVEVEGQGLKCPYCSWKTHRNAKDKVRGLKNHIKKCNRCPENINFDKNLEQQKPKPKRDFKINIEKTEKKETEISVDQEVDLNNEENRLKLLSDLDILKIKFTGINFKWNYNNSSSFSVLSRQKALFLRVLNDEAGTEALLKLLVISSSGLEKVANITNVCNLKGYANDVADAREEIYPILKNLVDTGVISVEHLSPEMRLGMVMISLGINRVEKNRIESNSNFLAEQEME